MVKLQNTVKFKSTETQRIPTKKQNVTVCLLVISISIGGVIQRTLFFPPCAAGGSVETTGSPTDRA